MITYIAILRGINVSGQKLIKMSDLKSHFENIGFYRVETYIQSGNIIFQSKEIKIESLINLIEKKIKKEYGFDVPVIIKSTKDLQFVLKNNPFIGRGEDPELNYVTFLGGKPSKQSLASIDNKEYLPEEFICRKDIIFFYSPNGYGKAKMNNNFFEKKLKVMATTRNWKTINKLYQIASETK